MLDFAAAIHRSKVDTEMKEGGALFVISDSFSMGKDKAFFKRLKWVH